MDKKILVIKKMKNIDVKKMNQSYWMISLVFPIFLILVYVSEI